MTSSWAGPLEFHNIQEIDIELMFELICIFFFVAFFPHYKLSEMRKPTIKQEKVHNYSYITILYSSKTHVTSSLLFYHFISNIQEIIDIEMMFELICMLLFVFLSSLQMITKRGNNSTTGESINYYYITVPW